MYVACTRAKENLFILKPHIDRSGRSYFAQESSVFTQPSRFLAEGNILSKFVEIESAQEEFIDDAEWEDGIDEKPRRDQEFLRLMRDYFRE